MLLWYSMVQSIKLKLTKSRHNSPNPSPMKPWTSKSIINCSSNIQSKIQHIILFSGSLIFSNNSFNFYFSTSNSSITFMWDDIMFPNCCKTFFVSKYMNKICINIGLFSNKTEIKCCNCLISILINILSDSQIKRFFVDIQI